MKFIEKLNLEGGQDVFVPEDYFRARMKSTAKHFGSRKTAVFYGRYSTSSQKENSIERQFERAEVCASKANSDIVAVFSDPERSGSYMEGRSGLFALLDYLAENDVDEVYVEEPDRISRAFADMAWLWKQIEQRGAELHSVTRGKLGMMEIAIYGILAEDTVRQLTERTSYGRIMAARSGRAPGGWCYGYKKGDVPGQHEIDDEKAEVVRRIYELFDANVNIRQIVVLLNRSGIPSPRGKKWTRSVIFQRTTTFCILRNRTYPGALVYGQTVSRRVAGRGRSTRELIDDSGWIVRSKPEWQIVPPDLWQRVQDRIEVMIATKNTVERKGVEYLLRGQVKCGCCGGTLGVLGDRKGERLLCVKHRHSEACDNSNTVHLNRATTAILETVRDRILTDENLNAFRVSYIDSRRATVQNDRSERLRIAARLAVIKGELEDTFLLRNTRNLSDETLAGIRDRLEGERKMLREATSKLAVCDDDIALDENAIVGLREAIDRMIAQVPFIATDDESAMLIGQMRRLLGGLVMDPIEGGTAFTLTINSSFSSFVTGRSKPTDEPLEPIVLRFERWISTGYMTVDKKVAADELAASGRLAIGDADWSAVAPLIEPRVLKDPGGLPLEARRVVDAALYWAGTKGNRWYLPDQFGDLHAMHLAVNRLIKFGVWPKILGILCERKSPLKGKLLRPDLKIYTRARKGRYGPSTFSGKSRGWKIASGESSD